MGTAHVMPDSSASLPLGDLLEHSRWVDDLARRLASEAISAEDLAQSTWLAALEHPPGEGRPLRQWLATVLRNFARQAHRGSARRAEREQRVARHEATPSTADLLERASQQREVVGAVMELDEPYRTSVLLRFFEGLPPREIARRLEVPVETVRTRVTRGLEKLRVKLDREHGGDGKTWMLALAPLLERGALPTPLFGTLVMNVKLVAAALVVTVGALGLWASLSSESAHTASPEVSAATGVSELEKPAVGRAAPLEPLPELEQRSVAQAPGRAQAAAPPPPVEALSVTGILRGLVIDQSGRPGSGVALTFRPGRGAVLSPLPRGSATPMEDQVVALPGAASGATGVVSGPDGRFELPAPAGSGLIVTSDPALTTVLAGSYHGNPDEVSLVVVVAPALALAGQVVDQEGLALEGASLSVDLPRDYRSHFDVVLDHSEERVWDAATDEQGVFDFGRVPFVEGARLRVARDGYLARSLELPEGGHTNMILTLERAVVREGAIAGRVIDSGGAPVEGARVSLGVDTTISGPDGSFAFDPDDPESLTRRFSIGIEALIAMQPGSLPARRELPAQREDWPTWVTLELGGPTLSIAGRVVDHLGEPMPGASVWLADATLFGAVDGRPAHLEALLSGSERLGWNPVETDAAGRFAIEGLTDRAYSVAAMDPATLLRQEYGPVLPGITNLELELSTDSLYPLVAGRILGHDGKPIGGVSVFPMCDAFRTTVAGRIMGTSHSSVPGTLSDEDGRFELKNVPRSLVYLRIEGNEVLPLEYGRYVEGDERYVHTEVRELPEREIEELEITVVRRCHLQIELDDPAAGDEVVLLDAAGHPVEINVMVGNGRREGMRIPIRDGRSAALAVPDSGRTLVLYLDGDEVLRTNVDLKPGELQKVRL